VIGDLVTGAAVGALVDVDTGASLPAMIKKVTETSFNAVPSLVKGVAVTVFVDPTLNSTQA
jgi:hypothetical protein